MRSEMGKNRLEAFSDGVIAIIITIMVLELKVPHGDQLSELCTMAPVLLSYVLSFIYVGIYWNNHHHLFHVARQVSGAVLWANLHLLFWLSVIPFVTNWMGEHYGAPWPVALYGFVLMMCGSAYYVLTLTLIAVHGRNSAIAKALGTDLKAPVIGFYGGKDTSIPQESITQMREALLNAGKSGSINVYPEAGHGFNADYRTSYNDYAATDAWKKMLTFFVQKGVV